MAHYYACMRHFAILNINFFFHNGQSQYQQHIVQLHYKSLIKMLGSELPKVLRPNSVYNNNTLLDIGGLKITLLQMKCLLVVMIKSSSLDNSENSMIACIFSVYLGI